jgi:uncharacterized protein YndB with AHSA1/START domain
MPDTSDNRPQPVVISRTFTAPRALVFQAWSTAEHIKHWFSPETYTVPDAEIDFRAGGVFAVCMRSPDGQDIWTRGTFVEVSPPDRLVFTAGVPDSIQAGFVVHTTVTFEDDGAGTRMTVRQAYDLHDEAFRHAIEGAPEGWRTTLDKLEREVARMQSDPPQSVVHESFSIERVYPATPAIVFHALSDKAAKSRWFEGGDGYEVLERSMDVRPGGRERLSGRWTTGTVSTFDAIYLDVIANARLVYAYEMHLNDRKISVSLATVQLRPEGAGTRLVITEQGAFLDGYDDARSREKGTGFLLERLGASLQG